MTSKWAGYGNPVPCGLDQICVQEADLGVMWPDSVDSPLAVDKMSTVYIHDRITPHTPAP